MSHPISIHVSGRPFPPKCECYHSRANPGVDWRFYLQMAMGRSGVAIKVILIRHESSTWYRQLSRFQMDKG